jgi:hypothetical protein
MLCANRQMRSTPPFFLEGASITFEFAPGTRGERVMRELQRILLSKVEPNLSREVVVERVGELAESIARSGMIHPIVVRREAGLDGVGPDRYAVLVGNHRVHAALRLGWTEIEAFVEDCDGLTAELMTIDENLLRYELTQAQQVLAIKRRKEIWDLLGRPDERQVAARRSPVVRSRETSPRGHAQARAFAADTSQRTGKAKSYINAQIARGQVLGTMNLHAIIGTSLDSGPEMDALVTKPEPERNRLIQRAKAGEKVTARSVPTAGGEVHLPHLIDKLLHDFAALAKHATPRAVAEAMANHPQGHTLHPYGCTSWCDASKASRAHRAHHERLPVGGSRRP